MATSASDLQQLRALLLKAASGLSDSMEKKMFGCAALFTQGNIFALVWKHGRIGVKLPDPAQYEELSTQPGAEPWTPGPQMAHWLLVPPDYHGHPEDLANWVRRAHALAQARREASQKAAPAPAPAKKASTSTPPASKKKPAARAASKPAPKKTTARR